MQKNLKIARISSAVLAALLVAAICTTIIQNRRAVALADTADATMRRALYESAELLGGLQGSLLKLPASSSAAQEQLLLSDIARQAFGVQENLAVLPADAYRLQGALKFVNQVQDYAEVLTARIAQGGVISAEDERQIASMAESALALQTQLLAGAESLSPIDFSAPESGSADGDREPAVEYPALIYDGPFSDGADPERIPIPSGETYDAAAAQEKAEWYFGEERVRSIRLAGEIALPVPCYEFEISDGTFQYTLCVTKAGGDILYLLSDVQATEARLSESECIDLAYQFLFSRGYGPMQQTYWAVADGFCTINFAAVQDDILLYPDLVKVDIAMDTGAVCGVEARSYLSNHVAREIPSPVVAREQAQDLLSDRLSVTGSRLCIIPTDAGEKLAWEFSAEIEGVGSYLIYIDALTGYELQILRLVETETGLETQ